MYFRTYPTKNNTIFHYLNVNGTITSSFSENINCGQNSIMEMQDGRGESKLLWAFSFPNWLKTKLNTFTYTANLQLFDAGTLFQPAIQLKDVTLASFNEDFVEGDGYSFLPPENMSGVSNWLNRDSVNLWSGVTFTPVTTYHLNTINEDLNFDITSSIQTFITGDIDPKFSLTITNRTQDNLNVFTKFIYSKYTRTLFQPYIEFFIQDEVIDKTFNCYANESNKVYLLNKKQIDFVGSVVAKLTYEGASVTTPSVINPQTGIYYIDITPPMPTTNRDSYATLIWNINGLDMLKQLIKIQNPNKLIDGVDYTNLFFYPSTPYSHTIIKQGDIIPFKVVSQIRGKGDVITDTYQYRITSADGFEMTPWTGISVYRESMYFYVDTAYFYPEQQYEVFIRNKTNDFTITSNETYKFKLALNDKSHLRELSASPYYNREGFLGTTK